MTLTLTHRSASTPPSTLEGLKVGFQLLFGDGGEWTSSCVPTKSELTLAMRAAQASHCTLRGVRENQ